MRRNQRLVAVVAVVSGLGVFGLRGFAGEEGGHDDAAALLKALPKSKHSLADGIRQAAKAPEVAISAKFELDDKGALSLSVYTAEKGSGTDAEHNVLKELAGSPEAGAWAPEAETFKDVPHVARASQQLTLVSLATVALADVAEKAAKAGTVYSITPVVRDGKGWLAVLVASEGKSAEMFYDLAGEEKR